jgi:hypothetical protein
MQAALMTKLDRGITFTEAVNLALIGGFLKGGRKAVEQELDVKTLNALLEVNDMSLQELDETLQGKPLRREKGEQPSQE